MDAFEQFRRSQVICAFPEDEQRQLFKQATQRSLMKGEPVWSDGQPSKEFVIAQRGWFKLVRNTGVGRGAIVDLREPNSLMCASTTCSGQNYCCSGVALEDEAEVTVLPAEVLFAAIERHPAAARELIKHLAGRRMEACHRLTQLSNGAVPQRLAALLCELAARAGTTNAHGFIRVAIPLTRSDLAQMCATTTESVIRQMSELERRGIVHTATRGFVVLDLPKLQSLASGESDSHVSEHRAASSTCD